MDILCIRIVITAIHRQSSRPSRRPTPRDPSFPRSARSRRARGLRGLRGLRDESSLGARANLRRRARLGPSPPRDATRRRDAPFYPSSVSRVSRVAASRSRLARTFARGVDLEATTATRASCAPATRDARAASRRDVARRGAKIFSSPSPSREDSRRVARASTSGATRSHRRLVSTRLDEDDRRLDTVCP